MNGEQKPDHSKRINLSPLGRLYFVLEYEMRKSAGLFDDRDRFNRLIGKHNEAVTQRNSLARNTVILDAIVVLLLFGKSINIPGFGIALSDLPAAREVATLLASLVFQFTMYAFLNWLGYVAMIETINRHRNENVDHDYISASEKNIEFMEKAYRAKMNTYGPDYLVPGKPFVVISRIVIWLGLASIISIVGLHLSIIVVSALTTYQEGANLFLVSLFLVAVVSSNLAGLLTIATQHIPFSFYIPK